LLFFLLAEVYNYEAFAAAFCVVLGHALYLPSAQLFALLPLISLMGRTGNANGCDVDYNPESKQVFIKAGRPYR
jgi:histone-lysine N-methyltransferase SETD3